MLLLLYGSKNSGKKEVVKHLIDKHKYKNLQYTMNIYETIVKLGQWKTNYVSILPSINDWFIYKKRPCARLIVLFAPSHSNWRIHNDDEFMSKILCYEDAHKVPNFGSIDDLKREIDACLETVRPSWDTYFLDIAIWVSKRANCMKGRVGCVLVKDNRIIGTGYNGTPSNMLNCYENGCKRCNTGMKCATGLEYCLCVHAEENALLYTGMERAKGGILYVTRCPCQLCCRKIVQMGIKEVVYLDAYGVSDESVIKLFESANVNIRNAQIKE